MTNDLLEMPFAGTIVVFVDGQQVGISLHMDAVTLREAGRSACGLARLMGGTKETTTFKVQPFGV